MHHATILCRDVIHKLRGRRNDNITYVLTPVSNFDQYSLKPVADRLLEGEVVTTSQSMCIDEMHDRPPRFDHLKGNVTSWEAQPRGVTVHQFISEIRRLHLCQNVSASLYENSYSIP